MNRKQKIDLIRDVLLGKRSVTELLPMRYDVIRLKPDDTEQERAAKLRQIEENRSQANVTSIIVTYE